MLYSCDDTVHMHDLRRVAECAQIETERPRREPGVCVRVSRLVVHTVRVKLPSVYARRVVCRVVTELLSQFGLSRAALDGDWDSQVSLGGNYFADNPVGEGTTIGVSEMHFY